MVSVNRARSLIKYKYGLDSSIILLNAVVVSPKGMLNVVKFQVKLVFEVWLCLSL